VTVYLHDNENRPAAETKGATVNTALTDLLFTGDREPLSTAG
jgi:hypothetical protein